MKPFTRRDLLMAVGALGLTRSASGQAEGLVASSPVPFSLAGSVGVAVFASGPCTVQVSFSAGPDRLSEPLSFDLTKVRADFMTVKTPVRKVELFLVQLRVTAAGGSPLVSAVIESPPKSGRDAAVLAAQNAFFVRNPAAVPGAFRIDLPFDANVKTVIRQAAPPGQVVREKTDSNVRTGPAPIPWDLANNSGARVAPGDYTATLVATPTKPGPDETFFVSQVRVL